ncbi:redoxin domain-containing protein [Carboxylicivirga sp. N1Y90]|uniref:redoxin domain-containing protein n=1 Tax=Carboxylicivirga fragile TaxID=3417571 RepID=UPI003D358623|nr:AhpC/TSA family protein [Marinilabiliaceae bacterium N1Y90]
MKKLLYMLTAVIVLMSCEAEERYSLTGHVKGDVDEAWVYLQKMEVEGPLNIDSMIMNNGNFNFTGKVDYPGLYAIAIDRTPVGEERNYKMVNVAKFYLENADITFDGDIETLPTYYYSRNKKTVKPTISGSQTHNLNLHWDSIQKPLALKLRDLDKKYMNEYSIPYFDDHVENIEVGIAIAEQMTETEIELRDLKLKFIKENINSVLALDLASHFFTGMYVDLTVEEINEMLSWFKKEWAETPLLVKLKQQAEAAKRMAMGQPLKDIDLLNTKGEHVPLSSLIEPGKLNMLEFWASWCGPCRGEIPHLRRVHHQYKDKGFNIISISIDGKEADWQKAMAEEAMVWNQLRDPKGMNGDVRDVYNVFGVPTCIILDEEGRIFKTNMRGSYLDLFLQETFDN